MKKRMILMTLTLLVIAIGVSVYIAHRNPPLLSVHEQLPEPKSHEHVAPDGSTVQHTHTYDFAKPDTHTDRTSAQEQARDTKHPIQRAWERLDLAAIKQKYQPYTVAEMKEMWHFDYLEYGRLSTDEEEATAEAHYPADQWLEDLLNLGHPFMNSGHYDLALGRRIGMMGPTREDWDTGEPRYYPSGGLMGGFSKAGLLKKLELPSDTTWDEYVQMTNKFSIVRLMNVLLAQEIDPDVSGGMTELDGSFLPFSPNLVNVHIDPKTGRTKFIGPRLTAAEEDALVNFGVAPEGMSVVYIDANNKPLPGGKVPRFFERNMKALETAQTLLQQQIEEHEFLLEMDTLLNPAAAKKQGTAAPHEHVHEQDPSHIHESPKDTAAATPQQRPNIDMKRLPPGIEIPPEIRAQEEIQRWFTALAALHGGQLPKDLRVLQQVITELEQVRQDAEKHQKTPPRPERPTPSEGNPTSPDANE